MIKKGKNGEKRSEAKTSSEHCFHKNYFDNFKPEHSGLHGLSQTDTKNSSTDYTNFIINEKSETGVELHLCVQPFNNFIQKQTNQR